MWARMDCYEGNTAMAAKRWGRELAGTFPLKRKEAGFGYPSKPAFAQPTCLRRASMDRLLQSATAISCVSKVPKNPQA